VPSDFAGLLRGASLRVTRLGDNHHHLVCRSCGEIADVDCAVGDTPCRTAAGNHGFRIDEAEVVYWGLCSGCSTPAANGRNTRV
jgi:Fe2+ or Zn2+ uptake regulation protein